MLPFRQHSLSSESEAVSLTSRPVAWLSDRVDADGSRRATYHGLQCGTGRTRDDANKVLRVRSQGKSSPGVVLVELLKLDAVIRV